MIKKKKKQIEELVTMLEKQTEQTQKKLLPLEEYEQAKFGTSDTSTNIFESKNYLTNWQKKVLKDNQQEEFDQNLDKLSKIIEAKKHDEEGSVSMYKGFKELKESGLT